MPLSREHENLVRDFERVSGTWSLQRKEAIARLIRDPTVGGTQDPEAAIVRLTQIIMGGVRDTLAETTEPGSSEESREMLKSGIAVGLLVAAMVL